jgi:hypothetical protein
MKFYGCRHTAISMALHSTLVMGPLGMNLHPLAAMAGHSIQTLESCYRHIIVRYIGKPPIDLRRECAKAKARVEEAPFQGAQWRSAQRSSRRLQREESLPKGSKNGSKSVP